MNTPVIQLAPQINIDENPLHSRQSLTGFDVQGEWRLALFLTSQVRELGERLTRGPEHRKLQKKAWNYEKPWGPVRT